MPYPYRDVFGEAMARNQGGAGGGFGGGGGLQDFQMRRLQLQYLMGQIGLQEMAAHERLMQLQEIKRQQAEAQNIRQAAGRAWQQPASANVPIGPMNLSTMDGHSMPPNPEMGDPTSYAPGAASPSLPVPGTSSAVTRPGYLDRSAFINEVGASDPLAATEFQSKFDAQDAERQKAMLEAAKQFAELDEKRFSRIDKDIRGMRDEIARFKAIPPERRAALWPRVVPDILQRYPQMAGRLPAQYPGDEWLEMQSQNTDVLNGVLDQANKFRQLQTNTVNTGAGPKQFNPDTGKFDVTVPGGPVKQVDTSGLPPHVSSKVQAIASHFDSDPQVKNLNEQATRTEALRAIIAGGPSGPADMTIIYDYMKGIDPTSVVRESERDMALKSGNIFAGAYARFNGYFKEKGGMLPENVKQEFMKLLEAKLGASRRVVKRMYEDRVRRINTITGRQDGANYLTDYSELYGNMGGTSGGFQVADPTGKVHTFPTQEAADAFKNAAGIK